MAYEWFKVYTEARTDAKLRTLSDSQHRIWFNLLCFAADQEERGAVVIADDDLLAIEVANGDLDALKETLARLVKLRIIAMQEERIVFVNWEKRQNVRTTYPSDTSKETSRRKQEQRAREKTRDATDSHERSRAVTSVTSGHDHRLEGEEIREEHTPASDRSPQSSGVGAVAPGGEGGIAPLPDEADGDDDPPELTRPSLALVTQAAPKPTRPIPRRASDASELAEFAPLAQQVAEAACLTTYDTLALARAIRKHQAHEPDDLVLEATKAAEWIANKAKNTKKRQMSVAFLDNWFEGMNNPPPRRKDNSDATTRRRAGNERAGATAPDGDPDWESMAVEFAERNRWHDEYVAEQEQRQRSTESAAATITAQGTIATMPKLP